MPSKRAFQFEMSRSTSLSQIEVAVDRTFPNGRVVGVDVIPTQPPKGVSTIQGNFLSSAVQEEVKRFLRQSERGRAKAEVSFDAKDTEGQMTVKELEQMSKSYLELEKRAETDLPNNHEHGAFPMLNGKPGNDNGEERMVDVILSDMSEPWAQTEGFWKKSLSDPYYRMMNTSGMSFRDHAGSMVNSILQYNSADEGLVTMCDLGFV